MSDHHPKRYFLVFVGAFLGVTFITALIFGFLHSKDSGIAQNSQTEKSTVGSAHVEDKKNTPAQREPASMALKSEEEQPADAPGLVSRGWLGPDPYARYNVMSFVETPRDSSGNFERGRVVKTEGKYPYLRIVEKWSAARNGDQLLDRKVMVADHVMVTLMPGASEAQLAALAKSKGAFIEGKVSDAGRVYLIGFQAYDVAALEQMIEELSQSPIVSSPEPDYVVKR